MRHMYKNHYFMNMSMLLFRYLAHLFREIRRKTKNGPFANDANKAVFCYCSMEAKSSATAKFEGISVLKF
ncbi:hypothetical protein SAMN05443246_3606 [Paenibacillus sp. GP183]|nr:hypothetical protein SAMN05443246_3606 [Paenibacillus sp. GP183]